MAIDEAVCLGAGNFLYEIHDLPTISIGTEPEVVAQGEPLSASIITDQTIEFSDITWKVNGETVDQTSQKAELVMNSENNEIEVTARTPEGCMISDYASIEVEAPSYGIPNAYTPLADRK